MTASPASPASPIPRCSSASACRRCFLRRMRIDHVIYGTTDLDAATARIEREVGLEVVAGGRHEGQGTHNRIVPLGNAYLELLAIRDREEAASSPIGRILLERITGDGLIAW